MEENTENKIRSLKKLAEEGEIDVKKEDINRETVDDVWDACKAKVMEKQATELAETLEPLINQLDSTLEEDLDE